MLGRLWALLALRRNAQLAWRLFRDPRVSPLAKLPMPLALLYVISPVDVSPDLLPLIGQMDDVTVLVLSTMLFLRVCPAELVREHLEAISGRRRPAKRDQGRIIEGDYEILE